MSVSKLRFVQIFNLNRNNILWSIKGSVRCSNLTFTTPAHSSVFPTDGAKKLPSHLLEKTFRKADFLQIHLFLKPVSDTHRILQFEKIAYKYLLSFSFSFFFSANPEFCYLILILISYLQLFCLHMQGNKSSPTSNASLDNVVKLTA